LKILILTFYYSPDLSAGSFRARSLVEALAAAAPDVEIQVLTTLPNRYSSFTVEAKAVEMVDGISIRRIALPTHRGGMLDQAKAFLSFARAASRFAGDYKHDFIFATSSRLMTAALGAWIAWRKNTPLYLDIRDIFVDTITDVLPPSLATFARPLFGILERWTIQRASKVNLVSGGFSGYFESRYPAQRFSYFTNGIDDEFLLAAPPQVGRRKHLGPLVAVYAGNLGDGQGLHLILPELAKRTLGTVQFRVFGDGGKKVHLLQALEAAGASNVDVLPPVSRDRLIEEYTKADLLFLHLNNFDAFKKVLPSKVFEYAALGKPIWAGVAGFSKDFIRHEIHNAAIFPPCDAVAAVAALSALTIETRPRPGFVEKYSRTIICHSMAEDILRIANERG
jgi:glycosyltransferase involved in cell wall biosynthesis